MTTNIIDYGKNIYSWMFSSEPTLSEPENSPEASRDLWSSELRNGLATANFNIDSVWQYGVKASQRRQYIPSDQQIQQIGYFYEQFPPQPIFYNTTNIEQEACKTATISKSVFKKIWENTLKLFTFEYYATNLENRNIFDITSYASKLLSYAHLSSFLIVNKYAIQFVCQTFAVTSVVAHVIVVAAALSLCLTSLYLIHRYAVNALKKPLKDISSGDTINLTKSVANTTPLSEVGREVELDTLETALIPEGAMVGLIGDAGTGKTEMAKLLAQRIASGRCTDGLKGKQVYLVNGSNVTRNYIEKLREHIKGHEDEIILVIDEAEGIFGSGNASNVLKNAWVSGPSPRFLFITTSLYYEQSFLSEEDSSWQSRIQPCITLEKIEDPSSILFERLKTQLPWMEITPDAIEPFAELAKKHCLRVVIKCLDNLVADKMRSYDFSPKLQNLITELQKTTKQRNTISFGKSRDELIANEDFRDLCERISNLKQMIDQEREDLNDLKNRLKKYQQLAMVIEQWRQRAFEFWKSHRESPSIEDKRTIFATTIWAEQALQQYKQELGDGLPVVLTKDDVAGWLKPKILLLDQAQNKENAEKQAKVAANGRPPVKLMKSKVPLRVPANDNPDPDHNYSPKEADPDLELGKASPVCAVD